MPATHDSVDGDTTGVGRFVREARYWIRDLGFPIFVAAYLLIALGPKMEKLSVMMERLLILLEKR